MALKCEFSWVKCEKAWRTANFAGWKSASKKLRLMKLLPNFYVFTYEGKAKLYAAEKDNDDDCPKKTNRLFSKTSGIIRRSRWRNFVCSSIRARPRVRIRGDPAFLRCKATPTFSMFSNTRAARRCCWSGSGSGSATALRKLPLAPAALRLSRVFRIRAFQRAVQLHGAFLFVLF